MRQRNIYKLNEARSIADEYAANWSDIPRDEFDQLIALDPTSNIAKENIGYIAKQLILPSYLKGEKDILKLGAEVTNAIRDYQRERAGYPQQLKNVANFPSVQDFVEYVTLGEDSEFWKNFTPADVPEVKKENPLDAIFNKYYKDDLSKEEYNTIIHIDPNTTESSLGYIAKNLLLRLYVNGEKSIIDRKDEISAACFSWESHKASLAKDDQELTKYDNIDSFLTIAKGGGESALIKYLKDNNYWSHVEYIGSTWKYDILVPRDRLGAAAIGGKLDPHDGNGSFHTNSRGRWCTTTDSYWHNYNTDNEKYYDFINKESPTHLDDNYQYAVRPDGYSSAACDGSDSGLMYDSRFGYSLRPILSKDPDIVDILIAKNTYLARNRDVQGIYQAREFAKKPFIFNDETDIANISNDTSIRDTITKSIRELIITDKVKVIPAKTFADWTSLVKVSLPDTITTIGQQAFKGTGISTLKLPPKIERIGTEAFANCKNLHGTTYLPASLKKLGLRAFYGSDIMLSLSKERSDVSLDVYEEDMDWFSRHLKLSNVANESLNEEYIGEDMLSENIPPDLAKAYKNSQLHTSNEHPEADHHEISIDSHTNRRNIKYDYANSTYTPITAEEAINLVRANPENAYKLRVIFDGQLVEYEPRERSSGRVTLYAIYGGSNPVTLDDKTYKTVRHAPYRAIFNHADKIYVTDEYDHLITDDTPTSHITKVIKRSDDNKPVMIQKLDDEGNPILDADGNPVMEPEYEVIDTIRGKRKAGQRINIFKQFIPTDNPYHIPAANHDIKHNFYQMTSRDIPDTGYHARSDPNSGGLRRRRLRDEQNRVRPEDLDYIEDTSLYLTNYYNLLSNKRALFKKFDTERSALKHLNKNRDLYDEDEFNEKKSELEQEKDKLYKDYIEICNKITKQRASMLPTISFGISLRRDAVIKKRFEIEDHLNKIYTLGNEIKKAEAAIMDDAENSTADLKDKLSKCREVAKEYQEKLEKYQSELKNLQDKIAELNVMMQANDTSMNDMLAKLSDEETAMYEAEEKAALQVVDQQFKLEKELKETQEWVTARTGKVYPSKKVKPLDDAIAKMLKATSAFNPMPINVENSKVDAAN